MPTGCKLLQVDAGKGAVEVVCGAPNARAGLTGVFATPGVTIPRNGMVLKVGEIRGVKSNGMMCSGYELKLSEDHERHHRAAERSQARHELRDGDGPRRSDAST